MPWNCLDCPSCISFYSYIKPQHWYPYTKSAVCCISFYSYIKPQLPRTNVCRVYVVYRSIPTSNRNARYNEAHGVWLYIVLFLHQTATQLNEDTWTVCCISFYSYIKPQPMIQNHTLCGCCISFYSYIKPQPDRANPNFILVVYRSIPTSNRNTSRRAAILTWVVYRSIPTSNRNAQLDRIKHSKLYIVLFLHQTATISIESVMVSRCISFYSYIKPQLE